MKKKLLIFVAMLSLMFFGGWWFIPEGDSLWTLRDGRQGVRYAVSMPTFGNHDVVVLIPMGVWHKWDVQVEENDVYKLGWPPFAEGGRIPSMHMEVFSYGEKRDHWWE